MVAVEAVADDSALLVNKVKDRVCVLLLPCGKDADLKQGGEILQYILEMVPDLDVQEQFSHAVVLFFAVYVKRGRELEHAVDDL